MTDAAALGYSHADSAPIDAEDVRLLWALADRAGRSESAVLAWLADRYGISVVTAITREHYGAIVGAVATRGPLPLITSTAGRGEG